MKLRVRNATLRLAFADRTILIDPFFAPKGTWPVLAGRARNLLVDLPSSTEEILNGVELVIVSHLHANHFRSRGKVACAEASAGDLPARRGMRMSRLGFSFGTWGCAKGEVDAESARRPVRGWRA